LVGRCEGSAEDDADEAEANAAGIPRGSLFFRRGERECVRSSADKEVLRWLILRRYIAMWE